MLKNGLFIWSIAVIFLASSLVNAGVIDRISDAIKKISFNWSSANTNFSSQGKVPMSTLDTGKTFLQQHNIILARDTFKTIVQGDPTNQEAQFLYAITRLAALYEDSNLQAVGGYSSVRKIFEDLGMVFSAYGVYYTKKVNYVKNYPTTSPRTGILQEFIDTNLLPEINGAIANLNAVDQNFAGSTLHASALGETISALLTADYADVLVLKSMLYFAKSMLHLSYAYNFDISIPDVFNGDRSEYYKIRTLFKNHPDFLKPKTAQAGRLAEAKQSLINAIDTFKDGATRIKQRAGQGNRLFVIDVPYSASANAYYKKNSKQTDVDLAISAFDEIKDSLNNGQRTFTKTFEYFKPDREILNDTARMTYDISKLFSSQIDFRSKLADLNGDIFISDYTFGGIAPNGLPGVYETITLLPGWNMVSFAMLPNDRSVANVLAPIAGRYLAVWGFDPQTGWRMYIPNYSDNTLTHFEPGKGYWINVATYTQFKVYGNHQVVDLPLKKGWNLVGYNNHLKASIPIQDALSNTAGTRLVWRFFNNQWAGYSPTIDLQGYDKLTHMGSGGAYWVYVANDTNFAPPTLNHTFDGYEVWGGNFMTTAKFSVIIENPAYYGYKRIGGFNPATTPIDNATFQLNRRYNYAIVKHASLFGNPVKIDGLMGTSADKHLRTCLLNIWTFNVKDAGHLSGRNWPNDMTCVDNKTAQIKNNAGIAVSNLNTTVYSSPSMAIDNLTVISGR